MITPTFRGITRCGAAALLGLGCACARVPAVELDGGPPCTTLAASAPPGAAPAQLPDPVLERAGVGGVELRVFRVEHDTIPVPDAEVTVQRAADAGAPSPPTRVELNTAGRAQLRGVAPGGYVLRARRMWYCPQAAPFQVRPGYVDTLLVHLHFQY